MRRHRRAAATEEQSASDEEDVVAEQVFSGRSFGAQYSPYKKRETYQNKMLQFRTYKVKNATVAEAAIGAVMRYLVYCSWNRTTMPRSKMLNTVKDQLDESGAIEKTSTVWEHKIAILAHAQDRLQELFAFELLEVSSTIDPIKLGGDGESGAASGAARSSSSADGGGAAAGAKRAKRKRAAPPKNPELVLVNGFKADEELLRLTAEDATTDACAGASLKAQALVIATLAIIAIKGGRATAKDVWAGLEALKVVPPPEGTAASTCAVESELSAGGGSSGEAGSGEERRFLQRMLVSSGTKGGVLTKQGYLKYSKTDRDDDGVVEWYFSAGVRAVAEVGWANVLDFIEQSTGNELEPDVREKWLADLGVVESDSDSEEDSDDEEEEEEESEEEEEEVKPKKRAKAKGAVQVKAQLKAKKAKGAGAAKRRRR